jgi:hypothetical protein
MARAQHSTSHAGLGSQASGNFRDGASLLAMSLRNRKKTARRYQEPAASDRRTKRRTSSRACMPAGRRRRLPNSQPSVSDNGGGAACWQQYATSRASGEFVSASSSRWHVCSSCSRAPRRHAGCFQATGRQSSLGTLQLHFWHPPLRQALHCEITMWSSHATCSGYGSQSV